MISDSPESSVDPLSKSVNRPPIVVRRTTMTRSNQHRELTKDISHRSSLLKAARASSRPPPWIATAGGRLHDGPEQSARAQSLESGVGKDDGNSRRRACEGEASEGLMVSVPVPAPTNRQPDKVADPDARLWLHRHCLHQWATRSLRVGCCTRRIQRRSPTEAARKRRCASRLLRYPR